jgi:hypothetical protein
MAEIRNYTMNFGFGRAASPRLTCALRKLACAEMHREPASNELAASM